MESGAIPAGPRESDLNPGGPAGAPADQIAPAFKATVPGKPSHFSARLRRALQVFGIGILVAASSMVCLLAVSWIRSRGAVEVVQAQVEDLRIGKVEDAYALFSTAYQAGVSLPMYRRWLRRQGHLEKVQRLQFWGRSVWGESAVLWGSFQDELGHSYPVLYLLVREKGSWRIDGFHLSAEIPGPAPNTTRFIHI